MSSYDTDDVSSYNTEDDESDEEDVEDVTPFEHDGKEYLIDAEYTVYDVDTHAPVGEYDKENDVLTYSR